MSQREDLKDTLLEELSNLDVFRPLVRYTSARGKLLRIVAALMASNKTLPHRLSEAYVGRYALSQTEAQSNEEADGDGDGDKAGALATAAGAAAKAEAGAGAGEAAALLPQIDYDKTQIIDIAASCLSHMTLSDKQTAAAAAAGAGDGAAGESVPMEALPDEDIMAIDLGLRLGSFLSVAGWMQESISVLSCLNERLKRMRPFKDELVLRLDCLQR